MNNKQILVRRGPLMHNSTNSYYVFLSIMNYFSLSTCTKSEHDIILDLIKRTEQDNTYTSLEELSNSSHVSQATISRFVRKIGFKDYQDFNIHFYKSLEISQLIRNKEYQNDSLQNLIDTRFDNASHNLQETKENLNIDALSSIINLIKATKSSVFFGTPESIAHFSRFRKDLVVNGFPCFFFYDSLSQDEYIKFVDEDVCAIFIILSNDYLNLYMNRILRLKKANAKLILLTQDTFQNQENLFDIIYKYGIVDSYRFGEYSLEYIATAMSCVLMKSLTKL